MGRTTRYAYDQLNRLSNVTYANESTVLYSYNRDGNKISIVYGSGSSYYSCDALVETAIQ